MKISRLLAATLAAILPMASAAEAQTYTLPDSNVMLFGNYKRKIRVYLTHPSYESSAHYESQTRKLHFRWISRVPGFTGGPFFLDRSKIESRQTVPVSYYPTDIVGLGVDRVAIAGVTQRNRTIIELRDFKPAPAPSVIYPQGGGDPIIPEVKLEFESIRRVFNEDADAFGFIAYVFPNHGDSNTLFFLQYETGDFYELDMTTKQYEVVATPASIVSGVVVAPDLDRVWSNCGAGVHEDQGAMYWFYNDDASGDYPEAKVLVLHDDDVDGTLDRTSLIPAEAWSEDLTLAENWLPLTSR